MGCFIDNAYRAKYYWLLKLRCRGESRLLKIEPGQRIHLSMVEPGSKDIDNLARFLRAHVRDTRIIGIEMPWWERIIVVKTGRHERELIHYIELIPRGLWVITSSDEKILYASRFEEFKDRVVKPGVKYTPPPLKGVGPSDRETLVTALSKGKDLVRGLVYGWGLPGYLAEEVLYRAGLYNSKNKKPSEIQLSDIERLITEYNGLITESERGRGYIVKNEDRIEFYSPYKPLLFSEVYSYEVREYEKLDEAIDLYFTEYEAQLEVEERKRELEKQSETWKKRIEEQKKIINEYEVELTSITKLLGVIYENYGLINEVFECIVKTRREKGWEYISECGVSKYDARSGLVFLQLSGVEIPLSIREPLDRQILELEKKRGELEKKLVKARQVLVELEQQSMQVVQEASRVVYAKNPPRYWYEKYRWSITRNGFLVVAGRDASQNEVLVKKYLGDNDIFLHADIHGAPATILFKHGREPGEEDILDAAYIAGAYSKAWKAGFSYIDVFWVKGSQVSKTPPSGEYIGKGAFMIYGEKSYVKTPLKLGLGLRFFCDSIYGGYIKLFAGSPDVVRKTSISYVVLVPGDEELREVSIKIKKLLVEKASERANMYIELSEEQIEQYLPGPSRIIEHGVGEGLVECYET